MASIASRNSVLAIVPEATENVLLAPSAATQYVPLQSDFALTPNYARIENEEIKSSIGRAADIQGGEEPTASMSFYLKGSGTEGSAPHWNDIAKSFFGTEVVEGTQRSLTTGSTTTTLVSTGAESNSMTLGYGMLIKDATNGYGVRVVHSVDTNDISLSFALANAPASGTNLGKPVYWKPASSGHQNLSVWHYGGNGGIIQAVAGILVNDFSFTVAANEAINASASLAGLSYFVNPIEITSSTRYIDWTDDSGTYEAAVTAKWYKDPYELAEALQTAMRATATTETPVVEYLDASGKFKITASGSTVLSLLWNSGTNTANTIGTKLGFAVAADDTGAGGTTGYTADNVITITAPHTPTLDSTQPLVAKNMEVMVGEQADYACFNASEVTVSGTNGRRAIADICAESGVSSAIINSREFEITVRALLDQYDVQQFARFRLGSDVRFQLTMGNKSGGNWEAGKVIYAYAPQCKIVALQVVDDDGLMSLEMTLQPYVPSDGSGEFFLGQL